MQSEQETKQLKEELEKLTTFIAVNGSDEQAGNKNVVGTSWVCDALAWVLGEIPTDHFKSHAHLDLERLKQIATSIELKSGIRLADYE